MRAQPPPPRWPPEIPERVEKLEERADAQDERLSSLADTAGAASDHARGAEAGVAKVAKLIEERFAMLFGDMATLMGSGIRIEKRLDSIESRLDATTMRVGRLDHENEANREAIRESRDSLRVVANDVRSTQTRLADKAAADKLERARMEERHKALKSDIADLKKDVTSSGQHAAVGEALARKSLDSVDDLKGIVVDEKREERVDVRETKKESREDKRHVWRWALALVGAVVLLVVATILAAHFGPQNVPHLPAPGAGH